MLLGGGLVFRSSGNRLGLCVFLRRLFTAFVYSYNTLPWDHQFLECFWSSPIRLSDVW
jgi:hypothetical protein